MPADRTDDEDARAARRAARPSVPIRRFVLGEEPDENLSATTTMDERLAVVWSVSRLAYQLAGHPLALPPLNQLPGRVIRKAGT